jgi:transcriptional regulator with XRE-family HTH domain
LNDTIVSLIRAARNERGITQKQLAHRLGKTQATMSDLERGKVQVSASELYQIADYLNKPIEYFYGYETGNKEIQDIIAILRKQTAKERLAVLQIAQMMVRMQQIGEDAKINPAAVTKENAQEFYSLFIPFANAINEMSKQMNEIRAQFEETIEVKELNPLSTQKKKTK